MKKIISMFMAVALVMATMAVPASAADGKYAVTYNDNGVSKTIEFDTKEACDQWTLENLGFVFGGSAATQATSITFDDVPEDAWYTEAVYALAKGGLVKGVGNGKFNPTGTVTYAEFITILGRLFGLKGQTCDQRGELANDTYGNRIVHANMETKEMPTHWAWGMLSDVTRYAMRDTSLAKDELNSNGMVTVAPENLDFNVLRAHAIGILAMAYERSGQDMTLVNSYTETDIPDWDLVAGIDIGYVGGTHYNEDGFMQWGVQPMYVVGNHLNFWPDEYVSDNITGNDGYNQAEIDRLAQVAIDHGHPEAAYKPVENAYPSKVLLAYNLGIAQGIDGNHTCGAMNTLTRAELCQLLYNAGLTKEGMCTPDIHYYG